MSSMRCYSKPIRPNAKPKWQTWNKHSKYFLTLLSSLVLLCCQNTDFSNKTAAQSDSAAKSKTKVADWSGEFKGKNETVEENPKSDLNLECNKANYATSDYKAQKISTIYVPQNCSSTIEQVDTSPKKIELMFLMNVAYNSAKYVEAIHKNITELLEKLDENGNSLKASGMSFTNTVAMDDSTSFDSKDLLSRILSQSGVWKLKELAGDQKAGTSDWIESETPSGSLTAQLKALDMLKESKAKIKILVLANTFPGLIGKVDKVQPVAKKMAEIKEATESENGRFIYIAWASTNKERSLSEYIRSPMEQSKVIATSSAAASVNQDISLSNKGIPDKIKMMTVINKSSVDNCILRGVTVTDASQTELYKTESKSDETSGLFMIQVPANIRGTVNMEFTRVCSLSREKKSSTKIDLGKA